MTMNITELSSKNEKENEQHRKKLIVQDNENKITFDTLIKRASKPLRSKKKTKA